MTNKYSRVLTVLLIVLVIIILVIGGYLIYAKLIKPYMDGDTIEEAVSKFDYNINNIDEEIEVEGNENEIDLSNIVEGSTLNGKKQKSFYNGYVMLGYIEIPKTNIKYPIIEDTTAAALETSIAVLYPSNAVLNSPQNIVLVGHNYRNGKFFSNNKKLSVGDEVYITGDNGKMQYTIYEIFETTDTDTSFYGRDTGGVPEITLSTCTDDGNSRLIIFAKESA